MHQQTLRGSFSAVSKLIFTTKYIFCSIVRDQILQDGQTFELLQIQQFSKFRQHSFGFFDESCHNKENESCQNIFAVLKRIEK